MSEQAETIIDIDDAEKRGVYRDFDTAVKSKIGVNVHNAGLRFKSRLCRRSKSGVRFWDDVNTDGALIELALGEPDKLPLAGTFPLAYDGDDTGIDALDFDISGDDLETALNANPAVTLAGGVTVEKLSENSFEIRFVTVGAKLLFTTTATNELRPESEVKIGRDIVGDAEHFETQIVTLARLAYCGTSDFTASNAGSGTITERQAGDATHYSIQRFAYDNGIEPYDGNIIFNFATPQITTVACKANVRVAQITRVEVPEDADPAALNGKSFQLFNAANVARLVWLDVDNTGVAPAAPLGGTLIEVDITATDGPQQISAAIRDKLQAHADFNATAQLIEGGAYEILVTNAAVGDSEDANDVDTGFLVSTTQQGANGGLDLKVFRIDDQNGSVGAWFNASAATEPPAAATQFDRTIEVVINPDDDAAEIALALRDAMEGDLQFSAVLLAGNKSVRITDSEGGTREAATDVSTGFTISATQTGRLISANVPFDAAAAEIEKGLENYFTVTRRKSGAIDFKSRVKGDQPDIEADTADLSFPNINEAEMNLRTAQMVRRMAEDTQDPVIMTLQGMITFPGALPHLFLRERVPIYRSVIESGFTLAQSLLEPGWIVDVPASADAPGRRGQIAIDGDALYYCFQTGEDATDRWRVLIGSDTIPIP